MDSYYNLMKVRILFNSEIVILSQQNQTTIRINGKAKLSCDCDQYAFAYAMSNAPSELYLRNGSETGNLRCAGGGFLKNLLRRPCPVNDCPAGCSCERCATAERAERANCSARSLPSLLARNRHLCELTLYNLDELPASLPSTIRRLVLVFPPPSALREAAEALFAGERNVSLHNRTFHCDCGHRELVDVLLRYQERVNIKELFCTDGRPLDSIQPSEQECRWKHEHYAMFATLAAFSSAIFALAFAHRGLRRRIRAILCRKNDDEKRYDAFISYSHHDERFVVEKLVPELERDYILCLHYRDWPLGGWIPDQIVSSVRNSHRTIVVISEHFVRSDWARAEFREAHNVALNDERTRLLAVVLGDIPEGLTPELHAYLSRNTYAKWEDPGFWDKLKKGMPRPRQRRSNNGGAISSMSA